MIRDAHHLLHLCKRKKNALGRRVTADMLRSQYSVRVRCAVVIGNSDSDGKYPCNLL
jgi:hypothetical protein